MASVFLGDLNDFIEPSQSCINPLFSEGKAEVGGGEPRVAAASVVLQLEGLAEVEPDLIKASASKTAKVSLSDCLACSGCVTSAETVLIAEQSSDKLRKEIQSGRFDCVVVSVGSAARASLASYLDLSVVEVQARLVTFFKTLGVHRVLDADLGHQCSIIEAREEFVDRLKSHKASGSSPPLPLLVSACPGWVCYAEKAAPDALPYMSSTKSGQQALGTLLKSVLAPDLGVEPSRMLHVSVEACFDKKLEASRKEFWHEELQAAEVDLVLTARQVLELVVSEAGQALTQSSDKALFRAIAPSSIEGDAAALLAGGGGTGPGATSPPPPPPSMASLGLSGHVSARGGSGGYLESLFRHAASSVFGVELGGQELHYTQGRNVDLQEVVLELGGEVVLRGAIAYGFRNIQGVIQKLKRGKCSYDLVEVMACPGGCMNGGGQVKAADETPQQIRARVASTTAAFHAVEIRPAEDGALVQRLRNRQGDARLLHTTFRAVPKLHIENPELAAW